MVDRRGFGRFGLGLFAGVSASSAAGAAEPRRHRAVFQVSTDDRRTQGLVLGNVRNYAQHYRDTGEAAEIEVVAFGPGFSIVRGDLSMMKGELADLQKGLGPTLKISACHNTRSAIAASEGKTPDDIPLLPGVAETPSVVVRIAELQEQGWAYVRS